jgi:hypothetical protein
MSKAVKRARGDLSAQQVSVGLSTVPTGKPSSAGWGRGLEWIAWQRGRVRAELYVSSFAIPFQYESNKRVQSRLVDD